MPTDPSILLKGAPLVVNFTYRGEFHIFLTVHCKLCYILMLKKSQTFCCGGSSKYTQSKQYHQAFRSFHFFLELEQFYFLYFSTLLSLLFHEYFLDYVLSSIVSLAAGDTTQHFGLVYCTLTEILHHYVTPHTEAHSDAHRLGKPSLYIFHHLTVLLSSTFKGKKWVFMTL